MDDGPRLPPWRAAPLEARYLRRRASRLGLLAKAIAEGGDLIMASKLLTVVAAIEAMAGDIEGRPRLRRLN